MTRAKAATIPLRVIIVGVLLITTALSIIAFTQSGLGNIFGLASQKQQVIDCRDQVQSWCQRTEEETGNEYMGAGYSGGDRDPTCVLNASDGNPDTKSGQVTRNDCQAFWNSSEAPQFTSGSYNCKSNQQEIDANGQCPP